MLNHSLIPLLLRLTASPVIGGTVMLIFRSQNTCRMDLDGVGSVDTVGAKPM